MNWDILDSKNIYSQIFHSVIFCSLVYLAWHNTEMFWNVDIFFKAVQNHSDGRASQPTVVSLLCSPGQNHWFLKVTMILSGFTKHFTLNHNRTRHILIVHMFGRQRSNSKVDYRLITFNYFCQTKYTQYIRLWGFISTAIFKLTVCLRRHGCRARQRTTTCGWRALFREGFVRLWATSSLAAAQAPCASLVTFAGLISRRGN